MTQDTKSAAKDLRKAFKAKGWNARSVSVRVRSGGMDDCINVTVKDASISLKEVREIAQSKESIDRCHASGEILSGGNTFVSCQYEAGVLDRVIEQRSDEVTSAIFGARNTGHAEWNGHNIFSRTDDDGREDLVCILSGGGNVPLSHVRNDGQAVRQIIRIDMIS